MKLGGGKQYIEIKDGNNYPLIIGCIILLLVLTALFTSKLWLPDNRHIMKWEPNGQVLFSLATATLPETVYYDESKNLLEFEMSQQSMSKDKDFALTMSVNLEAGGMELPFEEIKGNIMPINETKKEQKELVQIRVPEDWYYVTVSFSQKDAVTQYFTIDYRSVVKKSISDKGQDYLINREAVEDALSTAQAEQKAINAQIQDKQTQLETAKQSAVSEKDEKKKAEAQKQQDNLMKEIEDMTSKQTEKAKQVEDLQAQLKALKGM